MGSIRRLGNCHGIAVDESFFPAAEARADQAVDICDSDDPRAAYLFTSGDL